MNNREIDNTMAGAVEQGLIAAIAASYDGGCELDDLEDEEIEYKSDAQTLYSPPAFIRSPESATQMQLMSSVTPKRLDNGINDSPKSAQPKSGSVARRTLEFSNSNPQEQKSPSVFSGPFEVTPERCTTPPSGYNSKEDNITLQKFIKSCTAVQGNPSPPATKLSPRDNPPTPSTIQLLPNIMKKDTEGITRKQSHFWGEIVDLVHIHQLKKHVNGTSLLGSFGRFDDDHIGGCCRACSQSSEYQPFANDSVLLVEGLESLDKSKVSSANTTTLFSRFSKQNIDWVEQTYADDVALYKKHCPDGFRSYQ